MDRLN